LLPLRGNDPTLKPKLFPRGRYTRPQRVCFETPVRKTMGKMKIKKPKQWLCDLVITRKKFGKISYKTATFYTAEIQ